MEWTGACVRMHGRLTQRDALPARDCKRRGSPLSRPFSFLVSELLLLDRRKTNLLAAIQTVAKSRDAAIATNVDVVKPIQARAQDACPEVSSSAGCSQESTD